ncbi:MAG: hypothetical protein WC566_04240 [Dehalococcoidia bacterium]
MINTQSQDIVVHDGAPGIKHLRAIGRFVVEFNKLDQYIIALISILLGDEPELGGIIANSWQGWQRFAALQNIFAYRLGFANKIRSGIDIKKDPKYVQLNKLFESLRKVNDLRNQIVHSDWSGDFSDRSQAHRLKWKRNAVPGWSDFDYKLEDIHEMNSRIVFIEKTSKDLGNFVSENFYDYLALRAKQLRESNKKSHPSERY